MSHTKPKSRDFSQTAILNFPFGTKICAVDRLTSCDEELGRVKRTQKWSKAVKKGLESPQKTGSWYCMAITQAYARTEVGREPGLDPDEALGQALIVP